MKYTQKRGNSNNNRADVDKEKAKAELWMFRNDPEVFIATGRAARRYQKRKWSQ